jgi:hypothetical protein
MAAPVLLASFKIIGRFTRDRWSRAETQRTAHGEALSKHQRIRVRFPAPPRPSHNSNHDLVLGARQPSGIVQADACCSPAPGMTRSSDARDAFGEMLVSYVPLSVDAKHDHRDAAVEDAVVTHVDLGQIYDPRDIAVNEAAG